MKAFILFSFLLVTLTGSSQTSRIPKIKFEQEMDTLNEYVSLLDLRDENALVIETSYLTEKNSRYVADILVFQNDGNVFKYNAFGKPTKKKVKQRKITEAQAEKCWIWLNNLVEYRNHLFYKSDFKGIGPTVIGFRMLQGKNVISVVGRYPDKLSFEVIKSLGQQEQRLLMLTKDEANLFSE